LEYKNITVKVSDLHYLDTAISCETQNTVSHRLKWRR